MTNSDSGDSKVISQLCVTSVAKKFQQRIHARPADLKMRWELVGEPSCTIVSNVATSLSLPGHDGTGIHQVVFRIQSKQKVAFPAIKTSRKVLRDKEPESYVEEYLVLQRQFIRGSHKGWMVWGFTEFSTPSTISQSEEYVRRLNEFQTA